MTAKELQKRGAKAELLRVLQTEDGSFYSESAEGKILYRVIADDQETSCTCADGTVMASCSSMRCRAVDGAAGQTPVARNAAICPQSQGRPCAARPIITPAAPV